MLPRILLLGNPKPAHPCGPVLTGTVGEGKNRQIEAFGRKGFDRKSSLCVLCHVAPQICEQGDHMHSRQLQETSKPAWSMPNQEGGSSSVMSNDFTVGMNQFWVQKSLSVGCYQVLCVIMGIFWTLQSSSTGACGSPRGPICNFDSGSEIL
jgi:hypothetical protein